MNVKVLASLGASLHLFASLSHTALPTLVDSVDVLKTKMKKNLKDSPGLCSRWHREHNPPTSNPDKAQSIIVIFWSAIVESPIKGVLSCYTLYAPEPSCSRLISGPKSDASRIHVRATIAHTFACVLSAIESHRPSQNCQYCWFLVHEHNLWERETVWIVKL
jgi:hypothetical protein